MEDLHHVCVGGGYEVAVVKHDGAGGGVLARRNWCRARGRGSRGNCVHLGWTPRWESLRRVVTLAVSSSGGDGVEAGVVYMVGGGMAMMEFSRFKFQMSGVVYSMM